jgi:sec-independent protein translocase protein TatB
MFLDAGAEEIALIAAVALIVVGPKDLPPLLRKVGQFTAKMRGLAAEFRSSFDELARQSELDELRKEVNALRNGQYVAPITSEIDGHFESLHREFGAPPPPALTHEGTVTPGPDATLLIEGPAPAEAAAEPLQASSSAVEPAPAPEHAEASRTPQESGG